MCIDYCLAQERIGKIAELRDLRVYLVPDLFTLEHGWPGPGRPPYGCSFCIRCFFPFINIHNVSSLDWPVDLGHVSEEFWKALAAVQFESPALKLQIETWSKEGLMDIDAKYTKQAWWHTHTAQLCLRQIKSSSMVRDQLRLANQTGKFAGSWQLITATCFDGGWVSLFLGWLRASPVVTVLIP